MGLQHKPGYIITKYLCGYPGYLVNGECKIMQKLTEYTLGKTVISSTYDQDCFFEQLDRVMDKQKEAQEIPAIIPDDLVLPETISAYTPEAITGYPENIFKYTPDYSVPEYDALLINGMFDHGPSMMDNEIDTAFMDEIEKESIGEMFVAFNPGIVQKYNVPHLRLSIIEERVPA